MNVKNEVDEVEDNGEYRTSPIPLYTREKILLVHDLYIIRKELFNNKEVELC